MKSPSSGIEFDARDLPSSDLRPDPSWGIPQPDGKLRHGHKALSGTGAKGMGHVAGCNIVPHMGTHQIRPVVFWAEPHCPGQETAGSAGRVGEPTTSDSPKESIICLCLCPERSGRAADEKHGA